MVYARSKIGVTLLVAAGMCIPVATLTYHIYHPSRGQPIKTEPVAETPEPPAKPAPVATTPLEKSLVAKFRKVQPDLWGTKQVFLLNRKKYLAEGVARDEITGCITIDAHSILNPYHGVKTNGFEHRPSIGPISVCSADKPLTPGG